MHIIQLEVTTLDSEKFDLWAEEYDKSVQISSDNNEFPFAGYNDLLNTIYNIIHKKEKASVLDIGFGTGTLIKKLYDEGYEIYGVDFSKKMIEIAQDKMPLAKLFQYDFSKGLPQEIENNKFDYIISTYAMHHLEDNYKVQFINKLKELLSKEGEIIIGDIAFKTRTLLEKCKKDYSKYWDDEETYIIFDEIKEFFPQQNIHFIPISHCAGILHLKK